MVVESYVPFLQNEIQNGQDFILYVLANLKMGQIIWFCLKSGPLRQAQEHEL